MTKDAEKELMRRANEALDKSQAAYDLGDHQREEDHTNEYQRLMNQIRKQKESNQNEPIPVGQ